MLDMLDHDSRCLEVAGRERGSIHQSLPPYLCPLLLRQRRPFISKLGACFRLRHSLVTAHQGAAQFLAYRRTLRDAGCRSAPCLFKPDMHYTRWGQCSASGGPSSYQLVTSQAQANEKLLGRRAVEERPTMYIPIISW